MFDHLAPLPASGAFSCARLDSSGAVVCCLVRFGAVWRLMAWLCSRGLPTFDGLAVPSRKEKQRDAYNRSQAAFARLTKASEEMKEARPRSGAGDAARTDSVAIERDWQAAYREFMDAMRDYSNLS